MWEDLLGRVDAERLQQATLDLVRIPTNVVEFLIPVTIFITAFWNLFQKKASVGSTTQLFKYLSALFFGLIHGLGFSGYLMSLLGKEGSIAVPLLSFNLGVEMGQITIVVGVMLISFILVNILTVRRREWNLVLSGAVLGMSLVLILERMP